MFSKMAEAVDVDFLLDDKLQHIVFLDNFFNTSEETVDIPSGLIFSLCHYALCYVTHLLAC